MSRGPRDNRRHRACKRRHIETIASRGIERLDCTNARETRRVDRNVGTAMKWRRFCPAAGRAQRVGAGVTLTNMVGRRFSVSNVIVETRPFTLSGSA